MAWSEDNTDKLLYDQFRFKVRTLEQWINELPDRTMLRLHHLENGGRALEGNSCIYIISDGSIREGE